MWVTRMVTLAVVVVAVWGAAGCSMVETEQREEVAEAEQSILKQLYIEEVLTRCIKEGYLAGTSVSDQELRRIVDRFRAVGGKELDNLLDEAAQALQKHSERNRQKVLEGHRTACIQEALRIRAQIEMGMEEVLRKLQQKLQQLQQK